MDIKISNDLVMRINRVAPVDETITSYVLRAIEQKLKDDELYTKSAEEKNRC